MKMRGPMRLVLVSLIAFAACDTTSTIGSDFGVVLPGCHAPNACFNVHCPCLFASANLPADQGGCKLCDPLAASGNVCDCTSFGDAGLTAECLEQAELCVGRAATTCEGTCVHAG